MTHVPSRTAAVLTLLVGVAVAQSDTRTLEAVAATERLFAASARDVGWRAAFLQYFADDSIALTPDPVSARDRLRTRPVRPFSEEELTWEPKAGDAAASGDIAWLTGPSTFVDRTAPQPRPSYGNYLSVWKQQQDGRWRVFIDLGTNVPAPVPFPPSFTRVTAVPGYEAAAGAGSATDDLVAADRRLNGLLEGPDAANEYVSRLVEHARLHRGGTTPAVSVGAQQIRQWLAAHPGPFTATTTHGEAARSGDLGYVYGKYELGGATPQHGAYVRIWSRNRKGEWLIAADVTAPTGR